MNKGLKGEIAKVDGRVDALDGKVGKLDSKIDKVHEELQASIETVRSESKTEVAGLRDDFPFLSRTIIDFLAHPPQRTAPSRSE